MGFLKRFLLPVFLLGFALPRGPLQAQQIVGRLLDGESMQPIPWGLVELLDSAWLRVSFTYSDEDGDFSLPAPGPGSYLIRAGAYSYHTVQDGPLRLEAGVTRGVEFFIPPDPEELDPIVVEAQRQELRLRAAGFYSRQQRRMGTFITREEIDDLRPHDMADLLVWGTPGMLLRPTRDGNVAPAFSRYSSGRRCFPTYYLDGLPVMDAGTQINYLIHPNDVEAVEVYASRADVPARFRSGQAQCGTVLIWTRWREPRTP